MAEKDKSKKRTNTPSTGGSENKPQTKAGQPVEKLTKGSDPSQDILVDVEDAQSYTVPCGLELDIDRQKEYSGGQALLRTFFGFWYIAIPHVFMLYFLSIWSFILGFIAWWIMLFKGSYPRKWYAYQIKLMRWQTRVIARFLHLRDEYPKFGLNAEEEGLHLRVQYPGRVNRGLLIIKTFLRFFFLIPQMVCVYARFIASFFLGFAALWNIVLHKTYPAKWHAFNVGTLRWGTRVILYARLLTDEYPPFHGNAVSTEVGALKKRVETDEVEIPMDTVVDIKWQETYSGGQTFARTFFGAWYMYLPHIFVLYFLYIWSFIIGFISWWIMLFKGEYPENWYNYQVKLMRWVVRLQARLYNLTDGYPKFGLNAVDEAITVEVPRPEKMNRILLLVKTFFRIIFLWPHLIALYARFIASGFLTFLSFWHILADGKYPKRWHDFNVGTIRWGVRVGLYLRLMRDEYPPFTGAAEIIKVLPYKISGNQEATPATGVPGLKSTTQTVQAAAKTAITKDGSKDTGEVRKTVLVRKKDGTVVRKVVKSERTTSNETTAEKNITNPIKRNTPSVVEGSYNRPLGLTMDVEYQGKYSSNQAVTRAMFGMYYIVLPHFFVLFFLSIWGAILGMFAWWAILFTGSYPKSWHQYQVKLMRWRLRIQSRLLNVADEYPRFGLGTKEDKTVLEVEYPETQSRGVLIVKLFFIGYFLLPHIYILLFRMIASAFLAYLAFWYILCQKEYPGRWHRYIVDTFRWSNRVALYASNLRDEYPPFHGRPFDDPDGTDDRSGVTPIIPAGSSNVSKAAVAAVKTGAAAVAATAAATVVAVAASTSSSASSKQTETGAKEGASGTKTVLVRKADGTVVRKVVKTDGTKATPVKAVAAKNPATATAETSSKTVVVPPSKTPPIKKAGAAGAGANKEESKSNKGALAFLGVLAGLLLIATGILGYLYWNQSSKFDQERAKLKTQNTELQTEVDALKIKVNNLNEENEILIGQLNDPTKNPKLKSVMDENSKLLDRLKQLQRRGTGYSGGGVSSASASKYKREIAELKAEIEKLNQEIDDLKAKNLQLDSDNSKLASDVKSEKDRADSMIGENERMKNEIEKAKKLSFDDFQGAGVKYKTADKIKVKNSAKKLNKIQISFTIARNPLAEPGTRDVFVVITNPNGKVLASGNNKFNIDGEELQYSIKHSLSFSGKEELISKYLDRAGLDIIEGIHTVEVYAEDSKVGETTFSLGK